MRRRPTRPNVFRELKRFGVYPADWKYILVPTAAAYLVPFALGIWIYYIPAGFPLGLVVFGALLGSFNVLRASKPRYWLAHRFDAVSDGWRPFAPPQSGELDRADWVAGGANGRVDVPQ